MSKSRKKICYILPEFREGTDTHFAYLYDFINALSKESEVFLVVEKGNPSQSRFPGVAYIKRLRVRFLPLRILRELMVLVEARRRGYRIFYTHYSYTGALTSSLVARLTKGRAYYWNCGMPWLYGKQISLRFVLHMVNTLVTGTETMRQLYAEEYSISPMKITVVPNWIDISAWKNDGTKREVREKLNLPYDKKIVLFVHHLSERKGVDKIVEIAETVSDPTALFVIIGDGPLSQNIRNDIEKHGLTERILMLGGISHRDIASYFFAADVFIMPSEEEGFPHVLLEAMAAGVPFVAFSVGGVRDIVPFVLQQYCVTSADIAGFSERVRELLDRDEKRREVSEIVRTHVRKYDQTLILEEFMGLF